MNACGSVCVCGAPHQCLQRPGTRSEAGEEETVTGHSRCLPVRPGCQETGSVVPGSLPPPTTGHQCQLQTTERQQAASPSALDCGHLASLLRDHLEPAPLAALLSLSVGARNSLTLKGPACFFTDHILGLMAQNFEVMQMVQREKSPLLFPRHQVPKFVSTPPSVHPCIQCPPHPSDLCGHPETCASDRYYISKAQTASHCRDASVPDFFQKVTS